MPAVDRAWFIPARQGSAVIRAGVTTCVIIALLSPSLFAADTFSNGDMESDANGDGVPDGWTAQSGVELSGATGRQGGRALSIRGPEMPAGRYAIAAHAPGSFSLVKGKAYRFSYWWKTSNLHGRAVYVQIANSAGGFEDLLAPPANWQEQSVVFQATADLKPEDRAYFFRLSLSHPGNLLIDDVRLEQIDSSELPSQQDDWIIRPVWPVVNQHNLIGNASFELGSAGFGSWGLRRDGTWGHTQFGRLISEIDTAQAHHGERSLKITLDKDHLPAPELRSPWYGRHPWSSLFAGPFGWISVQPGQRYVLSAYLRADQPETVAAMKFANSLL